MQFSKMHGLGNDFMVVDAVTQNVYFPADTIKRLADRHRGIGFDQLLVVEPPYDPELDFHYRIFNLCAHLRSHHFGAAIIWHKDRFVRVIRHACLVPRFVRDPTQSDDPSRQSWTSDER